MRALIRPGATIGGRTSVPGDKSIAHRWLILAATALGRTELRDLPPALDVFSTARCLAAVAPGARAALEAWIRAPGGTADAHGFTMDKGEPRPSSTGLDLRAIGRAGLQVPDAALDCGNSGTTLRLLAGLLAPSPFTSVLTGDPSLQMRPMDRVAEPLRRMGAEVHTRQGRPPVTIAGGPLRGIVHEAEVPSAQVKSAVLLAGLEAEGATTVVESAPTRDHTERALAHLGAPLLVPSPGRVTISAFAHEGFSASVPGDISSGAFLVAATSLTGGELVIQNLGLNPSRTAFLRVMERMGVRTEIHPSASELGEPVGELHVLPCAELRGTTVHPEELPLVIDEVPVLAALAAHAVGESWFLGASELRVKESDRLEGLARMLRSLGGHAAVEGDDLVVAGGGLEGGVGRAEGDHRMAMAMAVAGTAARSTVEVDGIEAADVSFPGFAWTMQALGARIGG